MNTWRNFVRTMDTGQQYKSKLFFTSETKVFIKIKFNKIMKFVCE